MDTLSILLISLVVLLLFGVPVYMVLISSTMISLFVFSSLPLTVIHNALFEGLNSFPLLAIPCFVVAGTLMEQGGVTGQIIDVVKMLVGRMYGGLGITTIMACTFFAAISGSGPGTVAAVGTLLIPSMLRQGYSPQYAASVSSSGGTVGILIPPSNPLIIYGIIGNVSITGLFTAGFIPGFIVAFALILTAWSLAKRDKVGIDVGLPPFSAVIFLKICFRNIFSLLTPFIILGSIYSGICTPVEASIVAIIWSLFVGGVINRALNAKKIYAALLEGAMLCGPSDSGGFHVIWKNPYHRAGSSTAGQYLSQHFSRQVCHSSPHSGYAFSLGHVFGNVGHPYHSGSGVAPRCDPCRGRSYPLWHYPCRFQ